MLFGLYSVVAAAGFAIAFEGGRVLEQRLLGVQKLGAVHFQQDSWSRRNTYMVVFFLIVLAVLEWFYLPASMHPFAPRSDDETFSKRSMVLSSWSGILALGYGGIMAWMRSLRNERKLFHLAKMEYERNRQQQESDMDTQKVEITKHLKRAAAAGAAAVAQRQQYEKAVEEVNEQKNDRGINVTSSRAENERAWSQQLYQAMDMEAFSVAERAMEKRWNELNSWGTQIEEMRNRNKAQAENLQRFRETREERIKNEFDHFEGERERLVRLAQELEALKMDVEEYKEETRVKEEEKEDELNAREEELQKRDVDLKLKEEGVLENFYEPITLLVSPPTSMDDSGYEVAPSNSVSIESTKGANDDTSAEEREDSKETSTEDEKSSDIQTEETPSVVTRDLDESQRDPSLRIGNIIRMATQALNVEDPSSENAVSESPVDYQEQTADADSEDAENESHANYQQKSAKTDQVEVPPSQEQHEEAKTEEKEESSPSLTGDEAISADIESVHVTEESKDEVCSIQEEQEEAKEIISHDEDDEDEANEISSMADQEETEREQVVPTKDETTKETAEGDENVDGLVEIFKAGSDRSFSVTRLTEMLDEPKDDTCHTMQSEADVFTNASASIVAPHETVSISPFVPSMDDSTPSDEDTEIQTKTRTVFQKDAAMNSYAPVSAEDVQENTDFDKQEEIESTKVDSATNGDSENLDNPTQCGTEQSDEKTVDGDTSKKLALDDDNRSQDLVPFVGDVAETIFKSALASLFSQFPGQEESSKATTTEVEEAKEALSHAQGQASSNEDVPTKESSSAIEDEEAPASVVPAEGEVKAAPVTKLDVSAPEESIKSADADAAFLEYDEEADPVIVTKATGDSYLIDCRSQEELKQMLSDKPPLFDASTDEEGMDDDDFSDESSRVNSLMDEGNDEDDDTEFEDARHDFSHSSDALGSASQESGSSSFQDAKDDVMSSCRREDRPLSLADSEEVGEPSKEIDEPKTLSVVALVESSSSTESEEVDLSAHTASKRTQRANSMSIHSKDAAAAPPESRKDTESKTPSFAEKKYSDQTSLLVDSEEVEVVVHRVESI